MIRFVDSPAAGERFFAACRGSGFGCRLAAVARAYGFERGFARFWLGGEGTAFCLLDGVLSVAGAPEDLAEARAFALMAGAGRVFCPAGLAAGLGLAAQAGGLVLAKQLPGGTAAAVEGPPKVSEMAGLLAEAGMALDREGFYLDLSHRLRHGAALAVGEYAAGRLAGCAVALLGQGEAVLSAVAVARGYRRQGLGAGLVLRIERALPGWRVYLMRGAGENRPFYAKLGYKTAGRWREGPLAGPAPMQEIP